MNTAGLNVTTPTDITIVMTRILNGPRKLVWEAMIKPELLRKWMFTPPGWAWDECEMDVRVGGKFCWAWNGPDGSLGLSIRGEYREVNPPARIVHTERMEMGPGGGCGADGQDVEPWELLATLELTEQSGKTHMRMILAFGSKKARDGALASGMEHGMEAGYKSLDQWLAESA